jgi:hypothetical protein
VRWPAEEVRDAWSGPQTAVEAASCRAAEVLWGAKPVTAPAASRSVTRELGFDAHSLVERMWAALGESAEARFYSTADWERARWELWFADQVLRSGKPIPGGVWAQIQHGLSALLVSPAEKRRVAIEVRPSGPDADEISATSMMGTYKSKLRVLKPE